MMVDIQRLKSKGVFMMSMRMVAVTTAMAVMGVWFAVAASETQAKQVIPQGTAVLTCDTTKCAMKACTKDGKTCVCKPGMQCDKTAAAACKSGNMKCCKVPAAGPSK
jgi:hypothetical protein